MNLLTRKMKIRYTLRSVETTTITEGAKPQQPSIEVQTEIAQDRSIGRTRMKVDQSSIAALKKRLILKTVNTFDRTGYIERSYPTE